jgi:L-amino acid N-acyltransferase YncA
LPAYRGVGFEAEIYRRLMDVAASNGAQAVIADVSDDKPGRAEVLERMGF